MTNEKSILRAVDHDDVPAIRSLATRIIDATSVATSRTPGGHIEPSIDISTLPAVAGGSRTPVVSPDVTVELQAIEDLLTGNESERRQGMDRMHQLLRRLRGR